MTYQERLDMFAAHAMQGLLSNHHLAMTVPTGNRDFVFETARMMIEESDRICADKKELGSNKL